MSPVWMGERSIGMTCGGFVNEMTRPPASMTVSGRAPADWPGPMLTVTPDTVGPVSVQVICWVGASTALQSAGAPPNHVSPVSTNVSGPGVVTPSLGVTVMSRTAVDGAKYGPLGDAVRLAIPAWIWSGWIVVDSSTPKILTLTVAVVSGRRSGGTFTVMVTTTEAFGATTPSGTEQVSPSAGRHSAGALASERPLAARRNPKAPGVTSTD